MSWQNVLKAPRKKERLDINTIETPLIDIFMSGAVGGVARLRVKPEAYMEDLKKAALKTIEWKIESFEKGEELSRIELNKLKEDLMSVFETSDFYTKSEKIGHEVEVMLEKLDDSLLDVFTEYFELYDSVGEGEARAEREAERAWGAERERDAEGW